MDRIKRGIASVLSNILALFSELDADEIRENMDQHVDRAMASARIAAMERRVELEQELTEMNDNRS